MISSRMVLLSAFGTLAVILLCTTLVTHQNTLRLKEDTDLVLRSHQVTGAVQEVFTDLADAESAQRAYLATGDPGQRQAFRTASLAIPMTVQRLSGLVQDRPEQWARAQELGKGLAARVDWLERAGPSQDAPHQTVPDALRAQAGTLIREEKLMLAERERRFNRHYREAQAFSTAIAMLRLASLAGILLLLLRHVARREESEQRLHESELRLLELNRELEQRVGERTAQLESTIKELESFNYSVSHDLRSPLRGIDGFSQVLVEEYSGRLDETGRHYLSRIRLGAQRMGQLIDGLLRMSRLNRSPLERVDLDLSALFREVAADLASSGPERRVEVVISDGIRVRADRQMMRVVLENLLNNAWKFTARNERPRVEVDQLVAGDGARTISVRDNGVGFDMAFAEKLFQAFQRLHADPEFAGTGIGLAIVRRIIQRHGGRVWAEAEPGAGATVFFTIPAQASGPLGG